MKFTARHADVVTTRTDCLVLPLSSGKDLSATAKKIDKATNGLISRCIKAGDINGKAGNALLLHEPPGLAAHRLLLVGVGVGVGVDSVSRQGFLKIMRAAAQALSKTHATSALFDLATIKIEQGDTQWAAQHLARLFTESEYRYGHSLSTPQPASRLKHITVISPHAKQLAAIKAGLKYGAAVANGTNAARLLGDLPGNTCNPAYLASQARALGRKHPAITTRVLNEKQMAELKMGSLLSVTAGTEQPAFLITMEYRGAKTRTQQPVALVGKGVTFDSGGISLKPGAKMDEMKYDMCGAASVFGVMQALAELALPINVVGIVPAVENLPSGAATKPGDVVTSMSGQSIEILNTDAEGRLILCDALTYAARYKPSTVIDIATLTGACVVALGNHASGLFSNNEELAKQLLAAGQISGDRAWQMPLWEEYDEQLKSNFADMANIGGQGGGSVTAACFLGRFTKDYRWAHLDIAGTAWNSAPKGATGRPVPLLMEYLRNQAG